jgi:hypothetical protein
MDVHALSNGISLISAAVSTIKQVLDLIPESQKKTDAQAALAQAERELKIAEATVAKDLGYEICRNHFPPEIMLSPDGGKWECPNCHNKRDTTIRISLM